MSEKKEFEYCLLYNVKAVERKLMQIAEPIFSKLNIHPTYGYIITLIDRREITKVKVIAKELNLSSSTITRMIEKLNKDGYIQKGCKDSTVSISLSPKGKELSKEIDKCWIEFKEKSEGGSPVEEINALKNQLLEFSKK